MPSFTIVTTTATQGSDSAEVSTLADEFADQSEAVGYSRRMAEEMVGFSGQLALDFDFSTVGLYDGDLVEEDLDPSHAALIGVWVLDDDGAAFVLADEFREGANDAEPN